MRHLGLFCLLALCACSKSGGSGLTPDGGPPPDVCNSLDEALGQSGCQLTLGTAHPDYISVPGDQDWFSVTTPATMDARSLVHVTAGYGVPNTPVDLTVNLMKSDGRTSLARGVDDHGQGSPKPVDLIVPYSVPNDKLVVLLADEAVNPAAPNYDVRNPYSVKVEVLQDPDVNEPNDTTPTTITLTSAGGVSSGSSTGYLSTANDVDRFAFAVPSGRKVIYLHLTAPALNPPVAYRLQYTLLDPAGVPIAEDVVGNAFLPVDLATARLNKSGAGNYQLVVQGYEPTGTTAPVPGDLRQQYTVNVELLDDQDANEPNDTIDDADAKTTIPSIAEGQSTQFTGRIGFVPDPDWYAVDLPADSNPSLLHYRLVTTNNGGRFATLPGPVDHEVKVFTDVTSAGRDACMDPSDAAGVCPKGYEGSTTLASLVDGFCSPPPEADGGVARSLCLHSYRLEVPQFQNLHNFEGMLPVPPHAGTSVRYYFVVDDEGTNWADDKDYVLSVDSEADPDEAMRYAGGTVEQTAAPQTLYQDTAPAADLTPPPAANALQGTISAGYGRLFAYDPNVGDGVRGPDDYDAVPTDSDRYELDFPVGLTTAPLDQTWELSWSIDNLPDGGPPPYGLSVAVEFCDGSDAGAGSCVPVTQTSSGGDLVLAYHGDPYASWYNINASYSTLQPLYAYDAGATQATVTARPYGCFCFEPRFVQGGKFFLTVGGVDRNGYEPANYTVHTAFTSYPQQYLNSSGAMQSCPAPVEADPGDAGSWQPGCKFTVE